MKRYFSAVLLLAAPVLCAAPTGDNPAAPPANPETRQRREGRFMREGQGIGGTIGEMKPDGFTVKTVDGKAVTVKVNAETRFRKDRQEAKPSDLFGKWKGTASAVPIFPKKRAFRP